METALYEIVARGEEWFVLHDGETAGPYLTKEAAFQAAVSPISLTIGDGLPVRLEIAGGPKTEDDLSPNQPGGPI